MQRVLAVVFFVLAPALAWTEVPPSISPDRDLLIRLDQRQQQLDEGVKGLKDDFLRTMDTSQQAGRTQLENLSKHWDTNFTQLDKRLETHNTLLWGLLVWATGIVAAAFSLLWKRLGDLSTRLETLEKPINASSDRLDSLNARFDPISKTLTAMDDYLNPLAERLVSVERQLNELNTSVNAVRETVGTPSDVFYSQATAHESVSNTTEAQGKVSAPAAPSQRS